MNVWRNIDDHLAAGRRCVLVTVFAARGSAPRDAGARMIVTEDGALEGTIGGGALEWQAAAQARALAAEGRGFALRRFALGPELGQCCGGAVTLGFEIFGPEARAAVTELSAREREGPFSTRATVTGTGELDRRLLPGDDPASGPAALEADGSVIVERFGETHRPVYLFGAGHVGRALILALAPHPFAVHWVDGRADAFPSHMPRNVTAYRLEESASILDSAAPGAFVVVMTHSHPLDEAIVGRALGLGRFGFVGLIGSATKKHRFLGRLRRRGLPEAALERLVCPIGIAGIRSKAPAAIAAAVTAQLLQHDEAARADDRLPTGPRAVLTA